MSSTYRITRVDGSNDDIADTIRELHEECFGSSAPQVDPEDGFWWLAYAIDEGRDIAGFCGIKQSFFDPDVAYFQRVGVRMPHRGHRLQLRFTRVFEALARKEGFRQVVSDTTDNPPSANNLIACGYRIYQPVAPWAFSNTIYWFKDL